MNADAAEEKELYQWVAQSNDEQPVHLHIESLLGENDNTNIPEVEWESLYQRILTGNKPVVKVMQWTKLAAASVIILLLSVGGYFYFNKTEKQVVKVERFKNDVAPGGNKAILTLADGSQIILDSANNGTVSQQGDTKVIKLDDGQLTYNTSGTNLEVFYNTISTPKGGKYQIVLADGSRVWLNAASSLRFPTSFRGKFRNVELTGEGYFEVAKNKGMPFSVKANDVEIKVLGTHFNVNAYTDEKNIRTTLIEGSVKVSKGIKSSMLSPGKQAIISDDIKIVNADTEEAIAWKNGMFQFKDAKIESIMKQVENWYDVDVEYSGKISKLFNGGIPRNISMINFFKILELTGGVHFTIEGKKVTVMP